MSTNRLTYILATALLGIMLTGCMEDPLMEADSTSNPNAVNFTAGVSAPSSASTRSGDGGKQLFAPLELSSPEWGKTLYLHTYESEGTQDNPSTRGMQVENVDYLLSSNSTFKVRAAYKEDMEEYIPWSDGKQASGDKSIWHTERTQYWPGQRYLAFHAVYPAEEVTSMTSPAMSPNTYSFSYTAKKGTSNKDAEMQSDLMVATSVCNKQESVDGRAPLKFHHALTAVKFAVRDVLNGEVVNIKIRGIYGSGNCHYSAADDGTNGVFEWTPKGSRQEYSQNFNYTISGRGVTDPNDASNDLLLNTKMPEKTFMLIPQVLSDDAEIEVTIKRTGLAAGAQETITVKGKINSNSLPEWRPGHEYVYTISTSKDNWVYVLEAYGNHNSNNGRHDSNITNFRNADQIFVYSPSNNLHDDYGDKAYFQVSSYRYRANDMNYVEACPWTASHNDAKQYRPVSSNTEWGEYVGASHDLRSNEWIQDPLGLAGDGNADKSFERHDITMAAHHQMTDWPGDEWMQSNSPYSGNSQSQPWDLSTAGGKLSRNTANCYVIDREGWYCFPLIYGNAIKNGSTNSKAYNSSTFVNHAGTKIGNPKIENYTTVKGATIVWADVYNAVSDVQIATVNGEKMVLFQANKGNLQQGNVIIAVYDKANDKDNPDNNTGNVLWSWQIWINEHWLDPASGQSNAFNSTASAFTTYETAKKSGWRQRGDLLIDNKHVAKSYGYYISPYNIGWCDPKNVDYLRRPGVMEFVQYMPGSNKTKETGKRTSLSILQEGEHVSYKYGNNTYYQWGRKDAMVGFVDHSNNVKRNFGPKQYKFGTQPVAIKKSISEPNVLYCKGAMSANAWSSSTANDFWDTDGTSSGVSITSNYTVTDNNTSVTKSVYDPSPPGYVVPPSYALRFIGTDNNNKYGNSNSDAEMNKFNGVQLDDYTFKACVKNAASQTDKNSVWLTSTGNRWYTDKFTGALSYLKGGDNFNPQIVYLLSSVGYTNGMSLGIALGFDENYADKDGVDIKDKKYVITSYFQGRRAMARPVRPIRELN